VVDTTQYALLATIEHRSYRALIRNNNVISTLVTVFLSCSENLHAVFKMK